MRKNKDRRNGRNCSQLPRSRLRKKKREYFYRGVSCNIWSSNDRSWCHDANIKSVVLFDECLNKVGISPNVVAKALGKFHKVLKFPNAYKGCNDPEVLSTVLKFISNNSILQENNVKFYFVTFDDNFAKDSAASRLFSRFGFKVCFLPLSLSDLVASELQKLIGSEQQT